ncbi:hypothetical protein Cst_c03040 [Thermoclostridium stercorarium subsp. stercorarium DSM 8532]|jgi:NRPS condensation-like uncharacterized protein|uniref:Alcohol acetyltransferase n=2 Tax=Thermoclostridium stercorarium TaxID=1510 RepID=L7VP53_THES1|nr:hypothetical protein [Thermoclostridium stercorarium]AGC67328.1 hypothetical protein Cst_c03040 [Thermoclostridium stercorarium subsp. stercorarium DSM 8532]AGI38390.1 elongation domain-containing protein [Thermoclostridium stercorarium subsp. stercorarium DSM 8532]ANW97826.1 hypothetical protein CSTERTH_01630 [Thermoclostridium stercorarium subsp. thermolacticum DSM 2910]UZQ85899.1 hypothetical protein ODU73_000274 [Thermoclostridium stercorarium]
MPVNKQGKKNRTWYRLDNAAILYPSIQTDRISTVFRLSATLTEAVDPFLLQTALTKVIDRFPYYRVKLSKGLFWYYLEHNPKTPRVEKDVQYPCGKLSPVFNRNYLFRVRYYNRRIAVEFCHVLTDGTGALTFLKSLVFQYLKETGKKLTDKTGILTIDEEPDEEEFEDAYNRFYKPSLPLPETGEPAFHLKSKLVKKGIYYVITGIVPLKDILAKAKEYNVSLTVFLTAVYMDAMQEIQNKYVKNPRKKKPISISVPVNMRNIYPSRTMRNFSLFVVPRIDPRLGDYTFEEILKIVHYTMMTEINEKSISRQLSRNVGGQRNPFVRIVPLFIKRMFFPLLYRKLGENLFSGTISNLGLVKVPDEMAQYIERIDFTPGPGPVNKTGCSVTGFKDKLYITFGRLTEEAELERIFFTKLVKMGIHVTIESNE